MSDSTGDRERAGDAGEEPRVRDLLLLLSEYSTVSSEATLRDALVA